MKKLLFLPLLAIGVLFFGDNTVNAVGLKVAPLEYRTTLKEGEKQKGFIDISNPSGQSVIVKTSVEAFTQTDNKGSLRFFENEQLSAGILLDLDEFELGPREAVRMFFLADGTKLPSGDVYGAIFFTTTTAARGTAGTAQNVRVGTLFSIVNGTPGMRDADITSFDVPLINLSNKIEGRYSIKNTSDPNTSTGFYPNVSLKVWPFGETKVIKNSLVFAGRTRDNSFTTNAPWLGIYRISASYGESSESQWVIVAHPLALVAVAGLGAMLFAGTKYKNSRLKIRMDRQR